MRYFFTGLLLVLALGCKRPAHTEFDGIVPGINSGTFVIKNLRDSTLCGTTIKGGKFQVSGVLPEPGYYLMSIVDDTSKSSYDREFEVYLENGKYRIETETGKLYKYPKINSPSKKQKDLSDYYKMVTLSPGSVQPDTALQYKALKQFANDHPHSEVSAHLMHNIEYEQKPAAYYDIYKTFSPEVKQSEEGKDIGDKLSHLVRLSTGAKAPDFAGKMPDGKTFDPSTVKGNFVLIDFWRASNQVSRLNHRQMNGLLAQYHDLRVISVSIDSKMDWWTSAVKEDNMTWPQVSDLKGDDSQNATNWAITQVPTYCLLDGKWEIIARDIQLKEIPAYITEYKDKH